MRTTLLSGLLKTLRENKAMRLPLQIFETSDVVFKDDSLERKVRNHQIILLACYLVLTI